MNISYSNQQHWEEATYLYLLPIYHILKLSLSEKVETLIQNQDKIPVLFYTTVGFSIRRVSRAQTWENECAIKSTYQKTDGYSNKYIKSVHWAKLLLRLQSFDL